MEKVKPAGDVGAHIKFLQQAASYFEKRPTNGEDKAHWSNVSNAENCRKAATALEALSRQGSAEPVGWAPKGFKSGGYTYSSPDLAGPDPFPLYAAPPAQPSESEKLLGELLAVIHRDGGHYQEQFGTRAAVSDAIKIVFGAYSQPAEVERLREALESARAVIQEDRDEIYDSVTVRGDPSTMDEIDRPHVERMDTALGVIDAALASVSAADDVERRTAELALSKVPAIIDDAIARARNFHEYAGRPAWEGALEDAIRTAFGLDAGGHASPTQNLGRPLTQNPGLVAGGKDE